MHIHQLVLRDFRNYEHLDLPLRPGLTAFVGLNGQGKTNLLESVCFLSTSKSPRTHLDRELIRWEQDFLCARAEFRDGSSAHNTAELVVTRRGEKRAKLNGAEKKEVSDWIGHLNLCGFFPEDVRLVSGQPAVRRQLLDMELCRLEGGYRHHWSQYRHVLGQRNALLRELRYRRGGRSSLPELSEQLALHGAEIVVHRHGYVAELGGKAAGVHRRLSGEREMLSVRYESTVRGAPLGDLGSVRNALTQLLEEGSPTDIERGATQCGPHRDELALHLQDRDLRRFASQGQCRSAALALRIASAEVCAERQGEAPVLVLDDALSELDAERRLELLDMAAERDQVLLTTTDSELGRLDRLCKGRVFQVRGGTVEAQ
ncbi:MAG: DNA replication/repair protein RecF [Armatimonadetes bacterium CG_4_10_14_3_um_filter_66_18]|nr:DNA replication/repair protein RecF [Armatimonadota bacterium]PIU87619.1 MAG: DNA replication/repair protein RecF [Armatimonadetes bacterium CG06_land_8_20_14_3_00_66_21]PIX42818.1 MAG: DNA replication/repair protein RecF [Armatimonadetes bacterium CG_4_8_14_3_um_filter_66_20]PIY42286.1 MAG: DNA replication/repair protein RecF [Armatimonadetes bacterium CG_4_10_14_3_um_filter_66_18]PIZ41361.1 MAG: DNA replication/repair protein RecF [Armatimonadetes bacterium CG_4_10_14_0_8_um_filter_66_14]